MEEYKAYKEERGYISINAEYFSETVATLEFIKHNAHNDELGLHWGIISYRKDITPEFVMENIDLPWHWTILYANPNITLEFVENNPKHNDRYFYGLSDNPNLTTEFFMKHKDSKEWLYDGDRIAYYSDWSWKYYHRGLSKNKNFDISWYIATPYKGWKVQHFVLSNNFTPEWLDMAPFEQEDKNTWFLPLLAGKIPNDTFFQYLKEGKYMNQYDEYEVLEHNKRETLYKAIRYLRYDHFEPEPIQKEFLKRVFKTLTHELDLTNHEKYLNMAEKDRDHPGYPIWDQLVYQYGREELLPLLREHGYDSESIEHYIKKNHVIV
jgi:hypothetical protein